MTGALSEHRLAQLEAFVAEHLGLSFSPLRRRDLEQGFQAASTELGFDEAEACLDWLLATPLAKRQIEILASNLTVGETYFFRDPGLFEILEAEVLPQLIEKHRATHKRLRLWSVGCCTGEKPYSLAILLHRLLPDLADWNISLLATDINPRFLHKAVEGQYGKWSFRDNTPGWVMDKYFTARPEGRLQVLPAVRRMVTFNYLNLAEDNYPSLLNNTNAMDLIVCRNVLMYFTPERVRRVAANLRRCLVEGGWLAVSASETSHQLFSEFSVINYPRAILYRNEAVGRRRVAPAWTSPPPTETPLPPDWLTPAAPPALDLPPQPSVQAPAAPPQTPYQAAAGLFDRGSYAEAAQTLEAAGSLDAAAMLLAARSYANQGQLAHARGWVEKAIARDKLQPGSYYLLATILQEQGQDEPAVDSLKRALFLDQGFVLAHFALGNLARRHGKSKESERHFANAFALLGRHEQDDLLPEADGLTAGRLREIIRANSQLETMA